MIELIYIPNRFKPAERISKLLMYDVKDKVVDYARQVDGLPRSVCFYKYSVIVNGKVIEDPKQYFIKNHSQIIITPKVEDPATLAAIGSTIWTIIEVATTIATVLATGYAIYSALTTKNRSGNYGNGSGLDEGSPTYSWDGVSQTRDVGIPVAVIYGRHKFGGNVINEYISQDGEKSYLNMLIGLCEGEISDISSIKVNENPIENYDGVTLYKRYGTNLDTIIANFEDLHNVYPINSQLVKDNAYVYTTNDSDVEAFEVLFSVTGGLFQQNESSGAITSWDISYKVRYKLHTSGTWTDAGTHTISAKSRSTLKRVFRKDGLTAGQYDIEVTRTSDDSDFNRFGDLYLQSIDEVKTDDLAYHNTAKLGIEALATEQLSGQAPNITCVVEGKKVSVPDVKNGAAQVDWEDYYWDPDYGASGAFRLLSDDTVLSWNGVDYVDVFCANPIWCLKDLLINTRYGLGDHIDTSMIDDDDWLEMAEYCDQKVSDGNGGYEKRYRMDVVIDSFNSALDLVNQLCSIFSGFAFWGAGAVKLKIDKEESPSQLFGMSNIVEGSFSQSWKSIKETPNVIEVTFNDADKDYETETIEVIDEESIAAGDAIRKQSMRMFCTRMSQAIRMGRYALKLGKYINRTISFRAGIDAIACEPGDVISVSHDVVQWGFSGNVQSGATTTSIPLDRTVTIESGKTYVLMVRDADTDTIEEKTVTNSPGSHSTLTVSSAFSFTPESYDKYTFGEQGIAKKDFRIISMQKSNIAEVEIGALEYNENVYDDSSITLPTSNYSALEFGIPAVQNLSVDEHLVIGNDGSLESAIDVYFKRPDDVDYYVNRYHAAIVYYSDNGGDSWIKAGKTEGEHFIIQGGIIVGQTYNIAVVSESQKGEVAAFTSAETGSITVLGKAAPPDDVSNFEVQQQGDRLHMSWDPVSDKDFARYEIRYGNVWETARTIADKVDVTEFDYPVGTVGEQTFLIKAFDTSGNESDAPGSDTLTVSPPPEMNFAVEVDPWDIYDKYELSNVVAVQKNLYDPDYARTVFELASTSTWEGFAGDSWDGMESDGDLDSEGTYQSSGYLEQPQAQAFDLGTIFEFNVLVDLDYINGSIEVQISTSEDGSTWSSFATVSSSTNYRARYVVLKYILTTADTSKTVSFYGGTIFLNAANVKVDYGRDVSISTGGTTLTFRDDFTSTPRVRSLVITSGTAVAYEISSRTSEGMTVKLKDSSGTYVTGEIDWEVVGS